MKQECIQLKGFDLTHYTLIFVSEKCRYPITSKGHLYIIGLDQLQIISAILLFGFARLCKSKYMQSDLLSEEP